MIPVLDVGATARGTPVDGVEKCDRYKGTLKPCFSLRAHTCDLHLSLILKNFSF